MKNKNVIFIIGNGFDISHNMQTKYSDYANHFLNEIFPNTIIKIIEDQDYENPFLNKEVCDRFKKKTPLSPTKDFIDSLWNYGYKKEKKNIIDFYTEKPLLIKKIISNEFLGSLFGNEHPNWFDIENSYFRKLVVYKNFYLSNKTSTIIDEVNKLNEEFDYVKNSLVDYLKTIKTTSNEKTKSFFSRFIKDQTIKNIYIINFNYTETINQYFDCFYIGKTISINNIHGSLNSKNIIFGYGNDQDQEYQEIKNLEINSFLKYFKTFEYIKTNDYTNIYKEALDKFKNYEAHIIGHSLSLCDKTLLQEVLDSEKCQNIRFYKRQDLEKNELQQEDNFQELAYSTSRIISNEKTIRNKITNYDESTIFP